MLRLRIVLLLHGWGPAVPSLPSTRRRHGRRDRRLAASSRAFAAADETAEDGEEDQAAYTSGDADDECLVVVDPGLDLTAYCGAFALSILTAPTTATRSSVQEVLLQPIAHSSPELWARTADRATRTITSVRIVALRIASHHSLTLLISARALSRSTLHSVPTALTLWRRDIYRTCRRSTRAHFLRITRSSAGAADSSVSSELAVAAAVFVRIIADSVGGELAGGRLTAIVVAASFWTTAIAFLAGLDNAVTALLSTDGSDLLVIRETLCLDGVAADGAADVANGTRAE